MQGRVEVEEILEQQALADRNGIERPVYLPPAEMLRAHELKTYRDCPPDDCNDTLPLIPMGWVLLISGLFTVGFVGVLIEAWNHTWAHLVH